MKKIMIVYDNKQKVELSFWKFFFEWSGSWVTTETCEKKKCFINEPNSKILYILSYDTEHLIVKRKVKNVFYLLRAKSKEDENKYNFLCKMDWRNKKKSGKVISWLFANDIEVNELLELYELYCKHNMWKYLWLFQEFLVDKGDIDVFETQILSNCKDCMKSIERQYDMESGGYAGYAYLYCQYMLLALEERLWGGKEKVIRQSVERVMQILQMRKQDLTWYILVARLCSLNMQLKHLVFPYYIKALSYNESAALLFKIGRICENGYGLWEEAVIYYNQSYVLNPQFYRAAYKLAIEAEREGKWKQAVDFYQKLENDLRLDMENDQASVKTLEYLCKVWKRLGNLYGKVTASFSIQEIFYSKIEKVEKYLNDYIDRRRIENRNKKIKDIEFINKFGKFFDCAGFNQDETEIIIGIIKKKLRCLIG